MLTGSALARGRRRTTVEQAGERRSARLESVRGIGAISVLWTHAWFSYHLHPVGSSTSGYFNGLMFCGIFGLYTFFALSGYLLFLPFARRVAGNDRPIKLRAYFANRMLRVVPLYWVAVTLLTLIYRNDSMWHIWWRFMLFSENYDVKAEQLDTPMWSLAVEVQFYLLLPVIAWVLYKLCYQSLSRAAVLLSVLGLFSLALHYQTEVPSRFHTSAWNRSIAATTVFFVAGMLIALARVGIETERLRFPAALARGDLWFIAAIALFAIALIRTGWDVLAVPGVMCVLGGCVFPVQDGIFGRVLDLRPVAYVGIVSYSFYLFHWPILRWLLHTRVHSYGYTAILLTAFVLTTIAASASYRLIEKPFLKLRRSWTPPPTQEASPKAPPAIHVGTAPLV